MRPREIGEWLFNGILGERFGMLLEAVFFLIVLAVTIIGIRALL